MQASPPSVLIRGAIVWGLGESDILVEGNSILATGKGLTAPGNAEIIDASGLLAYPGLINTHHHLAQSLLKAIPAGINLNLNGWLGAVPYTFWPRFTPECMYAAARVGFFEMLRAGCTTCADHHYLYHRNSSAEMEDAVFQAAAEAGIRLVFCRGGSTLAGSHRGLQVADIEVETIEQCLDRLENTVQRFHDAAEDSMRRVVVAPTSMIHSSTREDLLLLAELARDHGLLLHTHLLEVYQDEKVSLEKNGLPAIDYADELGWLGPDVWFAHMVHANKHAIEKLGKTGTGIAHCPVSNCRLGSGIAPIPSLDKAGARISIGVDGSASSESGSLVNEMMQAWLVHRTQDGADATAVERILHWATRGGAEILGFPKLGLLAPGMLADLVLYDLSSPRYHGVWETQWAPIVCGEPVQARHVMVNGKWRVKNGEIPGIDQQQLQKDCVAQMRYLQEDYVS